MDMDEKEMKKLDIYIYIYVVQNSKEFFIHISKRTKIFI